jgi:RNA polymerase sigma factor (sigma-70 family)
MESTAASLTSSTLLGRLRRDPTDQQAWTVFVQRYGPKIYRWCRTWKLQEADAQDVTQNVLGRLAQKMGTFVYDPDRSFRGWLRTLTHHALSEFVADRQKRSRGKEDLTALSQLASVTARDDLVRGLGEEFDKELMEEAMSRVQLRVASHMWEAFRMTAMEGLSGAEVAVRLGMKVATVYTAKSKVNRLLQLEVQRLENVDRE